MANEIGNPFNMSGLNDITSPLNASNTFLKGTITDFRVFSVLSNQSKLAELGAYQVHNWQSQPSQFLRFVASNKAFGQALPTEGNNPETISADDMTLSIGKIRGFNRTWEHFDTTKISKEFWNVWDQHLSTFGTQYANDLDLIWYGIATNDVLMKHLKLNQAKNALETTDNVFIDKGNGLKTSLLDLNDQQTKDKVFRIPRYIKEISKKFANLIDAYTTKGIPMERVKFVVSKTFSQAIEEAYSIRGRAPQYIQQGGNTLMVVDGHTLYVDQFLGKHIKKLVRVVGDSSIDQVSKDIEIDLTNIHVVAWTPEVIQFVISKMASEVVLASHNRIKKNILFEAQYGAAIFELFTNRMKFVIDGTTGSLFDCKKSIDTHGEYYDWLLGEANGDWKANMTNAKGVVLNEATYNAEKAKQAKFLEIKKQYRPEINQITGVKNHRFLKPY